MNEKTLEGEIETIIYILKKIYFNYGKTIQKYFPRKLLLLLRIA